MANVKRNTDGLSVPQKLVKGQTLITNCTNNEHLSSANPPEVVELADKQYKLQVALANAKASDANRDAKYRALDAAEANWLTAEGALASRVQTDTKGDPEKIPTTSYGVALQTNAPITLTAPTDFSVTMGDEAGENHGDWNPVHGASGNEMESTTDLTGATGWGNRKFSKKSNVDQKGNAPGVMHLFRVRALGAEGEGPWSQYVQCRTP